MEQQTTIEECREVRTKAVSALENRPQAGELEAEIKAYKTSTKNFLDSIEIVRQKAEELGGSLLPEQPFQQEALANFKQMGTSLTELVTGLANHPLEPPTTSNKLARSDLDILKKRVELDIETLNIVGDHSFTSNALLLNLLQDTPRNKS